MNEHLRRTTFLAWVEDYKEVRRARRWFNREMGAEGEEAENQEWFWPEGEDAISILPREVTIKVRKYESVFADIPPPVAYHQLSIN